MNELTPRDGEVNGTSATGQVHEKEEFGWKQVRINRSRSSPE